MKFTLAFLSFFISSHLCIASPPRCSDIFITRTLGLVSNTDHRHRYPDIDAKITISESSEIFDALTQGQVRFGAGIFSRNIKVPQWLLEKHGEDVTDVRVSFFVMNNGEIKDSKVRTIWPENDGSFSIRITNANKMELASAKEREISDMLDGVFAKATYTPITNRSLVESLLPRQRLYKLLQSAAEKIDGETSISEGNRVSKWYVENQKDHGFDSNELFIDMSGLTKAEFHTVINEIANYLDNRSTKN